MTIQNLADIAQIIGTFAILVTLVYLARETRQNTDAIHASVRQASLDAELSTVDRFVNFPHIRPALISGNMDGLTAEQREQVAMGIIGVLRTRETNWLQHLHGVMDDETWYVYRNSMLLFIKSSPVMRNEWENANIRRFYHPGFLAEINQLLAEKGNTE